MNKDNAHLYIPLLQALRDGELEEISGTEWVPLANADFYRTPNCYRRKPKPREFILNVYSDGLHYGYDDREQARQNRSGDGHTIRVREVID
jgi:hypothetical protein